MVIARRKPGGGFNSTRTAGITSVCGTSAKAVAKLGEAASAAGPVDGMKGETTLVAIEDRLIPEHPAFARIPQGVWKWTTFAPRLAAPVAGVLNLG